jgi:molybdopterin-guanine dinucleotide biosynthesis protein B
MTAPILSIVGKSDSGKTTLIEKLIPELRHMGIRVGTVKHDVHGFEMDHPGKDSWRHKQAGASVTLISSPKRIGMVKDVDHDHGLDELLPFLSDVDIVLTEGYKRESKPKIEIYRPEIHSQPLCKDDPMLIALVTDGPLDLGVTRFSTTDARGLASFIIKHFNLPQPSDRDP